MAVLLPDKATPVETIPTPARASPINIITLLLIGSHRSQICRPLLTAVISLLITLDIRILLQTFEARVLQVPESSKKQLEFPNCERNLQIITQRITCIL